MIRAVQDKDAQQISDIYNYYISDTVITFEEEMINASDICQRIASIKSANLPWLVAEDELGQLVGYAYASKWRDRYSYRFSVEVTVYTQATSKCSFQDVRANHDQGVSFY